MEKLLSVDTLLDGGSVVFHTDEGDFFMDFGLQSPTKGELFAGMLSRREALTAAQRRDLVGFLHDESDQVPEKVMKVLNSPRKPFKYSNNHWHAKEDDKVIRIVGPSELRIAIDYDDVDEDEVEEQTRALIDLLAANRLRP